MAQLRQNYEKFEEKNTKIVVIGPENPKAFRKYFEENALKFYGIPDDTLSVLKLYGQKVNLFKLGRMPAQMLVDQKGILRYVHYGHAMSDIPETAELLELIDAL
ncbi:peroxiredoxin Q/BCP [Acidaminobacter hydrogenoformans DSM 2784]|uniref:Peroxiredoxin Q/BCP n=3 Tax=Acidaminobacter TaxID=65402 RepID=A0A1G5S5B2_9FIRM|nr:peroxiredoxin Q/BCP [Acidaminobacter hydrogenoformans DSM 2784]